MTNPSKPGGAQRPSNNSENSKSAGLHAPMRFPDWSARLQELGLASEVAAEWFRGIVALLKHGSASGGVVTGQIA